MEVCGSPDCASTGRTGDGAEKVHEAVGEDLRSAVMVIAYGRETYRRTQREDLNAVVTAGASFENEATRASFRG